MKRIEKINVCGKDMKYNFNRDYRGFGIYEQVTPYGYFVSQSYMIKGDDLFIICESYNNLIEDDLLDAIDNFKEDGKFGFKFLYKEGIYIVHPSGDYLI